MENEPLVPEGYQLVRELARDGSRTVYLAEDRAGGGQVTLTLLGRLPDAGGLDRLARGMEAVTHLRHPNILPVRAVADGDDRAWLVCPAVADPDLGERLTAWGPLPVPTLLPLARQVADALDAAHRVGVVHGGVRPGAVRLTTGTDRPYLTGFGESATAASTDVEYRAPEQAVGGLVDPRTDVYAFGGLLFRCLTGVPPFRGAAQVSAYRPELRGELDHVVSRAMAADPAHRFTTCGAVVDAAEAAAPRIAARPRRVSRRLLIAALAVTALLGAAAVAAPRVAAAMWPAADDLARVPAAVRGACELAAPDQRLPAADRLLRCTDDGGQDVLLALYGDLPTATAAYQGVVTSDPALRSGEGDCARSTGWEHRYPGAGAFRGRVMCDQIGTGTRLAWVDHRNRTVAVAERADGNAAELYRSWARWVEQPAYPSPEEQQLLDTLFETSCKRAPAGPLDGLDGVVAGVECVPRGGGAATVTYYRFADRDGLQRAYESDVRRAAAPSGVYCASGSTTGALGEALYYVRSVPAGRLLCGTEPSGGPAVSWTSDALRILARVTGGADRAALINWWLQNHGPRWQADVDAINQQSAPPFPTAQEEELLRLIPGPSREGCMRPTTETVRNHVGDAAVVGVACGTWNGASAYYYRFADGAALAAVLGPPNGSDCTSAPPGTYAAAPYTRSDGSTGVLTCGNNDSGRPVVSWTDDQTRILGVGVGVGLDAAQLLQWWQTEAGPL
jgi:eukaryotic-like serine/threonine-protein kinase